jgi:hypothetical protein
LGTTEIPFRQPPRQPQQPPKPPATPPKKEEQPGRTLWFPSGKPETAPKLDELAFLKSVTGNEAPTGPLPTSLPTPVPRRASGGFGKPADPPAAPSAGNAAPSTGPPSGTASGAEQSWPRYSGRSPKVLQQRNPP